MDIIRRRRLPHWDVSGATYFVTPCLHDSIPAQGLLDIARYRGELEAQPQPTNVSKQAAAVKRWKRVFARSEFWLDCHPAVRHLEDQTLARIVEKSLFHFVDERYQLLSYVIMPSHAHLVFAPLEAWVASLGASARKRTPRERIMHSFKLFTGNQCNKLLGQTGAFWQHDSYDHWVRDVEELERIIAYVEDNPVKAGLVEAPEQWPFSSAHVRQEKEYPGSAVARLSESGSAAAPDSESRATISCRSPYARQQLGLEWGVPLPRRPACSLDESSPVTNRATQHRTGF